jgi:hypothetical protein
VATLVVMVVFAVSRRWSWWRWRGVIGGRGGGVSGVAVGGCVGGSFQDGYIEASEFTP